MTEWIETSNALAGGWAMALWRGAWQGGLAILLAWAICRAVPRLPSSARCWLWRLAVAKLLLAFLWPAPLDVPLLPSPAALARAADAPARTGGDPAPRQTSGQRTARTGAHALAASASGATGQRSSLPLGRISGAAGLLLWLGGVGWCAARIAREKRRARDLLRACASIQDAGLSDLCRELCGQLGLRRAPLLMACEGAPGPLLVGALRPVVILPRHAIDACEQDRRLILAHELAHLRRRDLWWGWLLAAAQSAFFFHPLLWLAAREWRLAHEMACDELAVRTTGAPAAEYGKALLQAAEGERGLGFAAAGLSESHRMLRERLVAMRSLRSTLPRWVAIAGSLLLVSGALALLPWRAVPREARAEEGGDEPVLVKQALNIAGKVTDAAGKPVAGARVYVYDVLVMRPREEHLLADVYVSGRRGKLLATRTTAADGAYRFGPLQFHVYRLRQQQRPMRPLLKVAVLHPAYGVTGFSGEAATSPGVRLNFALAPRTTLEGKVMDTARKPITGATARAYAVGTRTPPERGLLIPSPYNERYAARTDQAGVFRIAGLPQGYGVSLQVSAPGRVTVYEYTRTARAARSGPKRVVLARAAEVRGRVVYGDTGKPAAGVPVFARNRNRYEAASNLPGSGMAQTYVRTGRDGRFRLGGIPEGAWNIGVDLGDPKAEGWTAATVPVSVKAGQVVSGFRLVLTKGVPLTLRVLDARTGQGVAGARISVGSSARPGLSSFLQVTTDAKGEAQLRLPPGHVRASLGLARGWFLGGRRLRQEADLKAGQPQTITFRLDPGVPVEGAVADDAGRPVPGALVQAGIAMGPGDWTWQRLGITDARGRFRALGVQPGSEYRLRGLTLELDTPDPPALRVGDSTPAPVTITVRKYDGGTLVGRVVDARGRLAAGIWVYAEELAPDGSVAVKVLGSSTRTDARGAYTLGRIWAGKRYRVATFKDASSPSVLARRGQPNRVPDLVLLRMAK